MNGARVLISPLSWGFGHAGRMIPLAMALRRRGCEVIFAADARLAEMIERELPGIPTVEISGLTIRYSRFLPQYISIFLRLPVIIASALKEHRELRLLAEELRPSVIISDNRFGFYHKKIFSVYVTHQVKIAFPALLRFLEPLAAWMHRMIIRRYDLCLVPDYPGSANLSGRLSHGTRLPANVAWMGPLSRFTMADSDLAGTRHGSFASSGPDQSVVDQTDPGTSASDQVVDRPVVVAPVQPYACLILSGPEPQRSMLLQKTAESVNQFPLTVLTATPVLRPLPSGPGLKLITAPSTATMRQIISGASLVIARAGYTSVMELVSLRKGAVLVPTPGQTEQEYLGRHLNGRFGFIAMKQGRLEQLNALVAERVSHSPGEEPADQITNPGKEQADNINTPAGSADNTGKIMVWEPLPDPAPLFEKVLKLLSEQKPE